jgi:hypothetical protein
VSKNKGGSTHGGRRADLSFLRTQNLQEPAEKNISERCNTTFCGDAGKMTLLLNFKGLHCQFLLLPPWKNKKF